MTDQYLERRLENVEITLNGLRHDVVDMRQDVSELRTGQASLRQEVSELRTGQASLQQDVSELRTGQATLQQDVSELRGSHGSLSQYVVAMDQRLTAAIEQTNVHMRVLHEDLVQRLADGRPSSPQRARKPKKSAD